MADWHNTILDFWFNELAPKDWWAKNEAVDRDISERFQQLWETEQQKPTNAFLASSGDALAATILFDQFPRNMFRDDKRAFSTDSRAQEIAEGAVAAKFDQQLDERQRPFQYMPFMHAEDLRLQNMSLELFGKLGSNEKFAASHHAVIGRFGRFPHRNAVLGRETTPEEAQAIADGASW